MTLITFPPWSRSRAPMQPVRSNIWTQRPPRFRRAHAATTLSPVGIGAEEALRRFRETVAPSLSASAGPRYLGFVTGGTTPAALIGDWLAAVFDQNPVSRLDGATALQIERDTVTMPKDQLIPNG